MAQDPTGALLLSDPFLVPLRDKPDLFPYLEEVWRIFHRLSRRRMSGMSVGAIPFAEFEAYCETFGVVSVEERDWIFVRLEALDEAFLTHIREQHKQETASEERHGRTQDQH